MSRARPDEPSPEDAWLPRRALVVGLARSGLAAAVALAGRGCRGRGVRAVVGAGNERLGGRVVRDDRAFIERDPISRLDADELVAALKRARFTAVRADTEDVDDPWAVTEQSVDARLDAIGAPGHPSRRERWQSRYTAEEVDALVAHVKSYVGTTLPLRWVHLWLTARAP